MMMMMTIKIMSRCSVTLPAVPYLSHFTEGQTKEGTVRLHDLIKTGEEKNWRSLKSRCLGCGLEV